MAIPYIILFSLTVMSIYSSPDDYIWINYNIQLPVKNYNTTTAVLSIPCEARIGACNIRYTMLPPGWSATTDGKMVVPLADTTRVAAFAIKAIISSVFDDRVEVDLVGMFSGGAFGVRDRGEFLRANGYKEEESSIKPMENKIDTEIKKNIKLEGFPSLDQLQNLIKYSDIYKVSSKLKQISQKYGPCQDRIQYLSRIGQALRSKISGNEAIINEFQQGVDTAKKNIENLEDQKKEIQGRLSADKSYADLQKSMKSLSTTKDGVQNSLEKYEYLANRYLSSMNNLSIGIDQRKNRTEELEITQLEDQIKKLDQVIADAMKKKNQLEQTLKTKKSLLSTPSPFLQTKQQKQNIAQLLALYESKYRQYSDLAITTRVQLKSITQQLSSVTTRYNIRNADVTAMEQKIKDANKELSERVKEEKLKAVQDQINVNEIFKLSQENLRGKVNLLRASQCGYGG